MKTQSWFRVAGALGVMCVLFPMPRANAARTALPGTINYIEGQASIDGNLLNSAQEGNISLKGDQILSTDRGKVEVLLSPGAFLRVAGNSQIRMVSAGMSDPTVEVVRGEAMVEVDYLPKPARLDVLERGADAALLKEGLYRFDADEGRISVIDGKTEVSDNGTAKQFGKGKEVVLTGATLKPVSFNTKSPDELYRWSAVRAGYLAEANEASARTVYVSGGWGPWGPGWAWSPYFSTWSWLPGDGYFLSPFGYPFFSPGYVMYAPYYGLGRGYYGGGRFIPAPRTAGFAAAPHTAFVGGAGSAGGGHFGGGGGRR
jgi:hypothetical protein